MGRPLSSPDWVRISTFTPDVRPCLNSGRTIIPGFMERKRPANKPTKKQLPSLALFFISYKCTGGFFFLLLFCFALILATVQITLELLRLLSCFALFILLFSLTFFFLFSQNTSLIPTPRHPGAQQKPHHRSGNRQVNINR